MEKGRQRNDAKRLNNKTTPNDAPFSAGTAISAEKGASLGASSDEKKNLPTEFSNSVGRFGLCLYGHSDTVWPLAERTYGRFIFWNFEPPRAF